MADKIVDSPWDDQCEQAIKFIQKYQLNSDQIAYKFKRKEIGYICEYLGFKYDPARKEIESAKILTDALRGLCNG